MTVSSGRCHGPGCTQPAVVEYWCSERCQLNWDRQAAGLAPVKPWPPSGYVSPVTRAGGFLIPGVERTLTAIQRDLEARQWEALRAANPPLMPGYGVGDALGVLSGVPIELVEDERDSTLYRAPVEAVGVFEAFDGPPTFGPLSIAVEGDSEERVCEPSALDLSRGWLSRLFDRLFGRTT